MSAPETVVQPPDGSLAYVPRGLEAQRRATLASALVDAQSAVHGVEKESTNPFHRYKYASAEDVIQEARRALGVAGLSLSIVRATMKAGVVPALRYDAKDPDKGTPAVAHIVYRLEHVNGEHRDIETETPIIEEKGRPLDKAFATARTYSLSYVLRDLLLLPRVEEGTDVDDRDDRNLGSGARRSTKEGKAEAKQEQAATSPAPEPLGASFAALKTEAELKMSTLDLSDGAAYEALRAWMNNLPKDLKRTLKPVWDGLMAKRAEAHGPEAAE